MRFAEASSSLSRVVATVIVVTNATPSAETRDVACRVVSMGGQAAVARAAAWTTCGFLHQSRLAMGGRRRRSQSGGREGMRRTWQEDGRIERRGEQEPASDDPDKGGEYKDLQCGDDAVDM